MRDAQYFVQKRQIATRMGDDFLRDLTLAQGLNAFTLTLQRKLAISKNVDLDNLHIHSFSFVNREKDTKYFDIEYDYETKFLQEDIESSFAKVLFDKYEGEIISIYFSSGFCDYISLNVSIPKKYIDEIMKPFAEIKIKNDLTGSIPGLFTRVLLNFKYV